MNMVAVKKVALGGLVVAAGGILAAPAHAAGPIDRPLSVIQQMLPGPLKDKLLSCQGQSLTPNSFSIGHRGAPLEYPEHTIESYTAAAQMGAGVLECDVTFTKDKVLVCRHSQSDLHETTNILKTDLAEQCHKPFEGAGLLGNAGAECRASDVTLAEFKSLKGVHGRVDKKAESLDGYMANLSGAGVLVTHVESITLFKSLGVKFTPELKRPAVDMPYDGMTQQDYAQALIDDYKQAGIAPEDVYAQSFNLDDIRYWIANEPEFGKQAVYLDGRFSTGGFNMHDPASWSPGMQALKDEGVNFIAPPLWMLVTSEDGKIVPSVYAKEAKAAGLKIVAWTVERSGSLENGGGWYYQTVKDLINNDGQVFDLLDVLAKDVGVEAVFSDWPATTTYYANCMGIEGAL